MGSGLGLLCRRQHISRESRQEIHELLIIWEDAKNVELGRVYDVDNSILALPGRETLPLLSTIDQVSYSVFAAAEMSVLISEVTRSSVSLPTGVSRAIIDQVGGLARQCARVPGTTLTFTPFEGCGELA